MTLATIYQQITGYKGSIEHDAYRAIFGLLAIGAGATDPQSAKECSLVRNMLAEFSSIECAWSLIVGGVLWQSGSRTVADFMNIWNCARFAGVFSRFSHIGTTEHLEIAKDLKVAQPSPAAFIILGNAQRELYRYADAEDAYLEGIHKFPDDPFLKFRLADLYLATYKLPQAHQLLAHLQPLYPYAREMMFVLPPSGGTTVPENHLPPLSCGDKDMVCFVAADPLYMEKFASNYAKSVASCAGNSVHFHFHVIRDPSSEVAPDTYAELQAIVGNPTFTERKTELAGANPDWRKTLFACERFLFLAELLAKYQKPILLTDIDVEYLKDPRVLIAMLGSNDIGYTNFRNTTEAWERYAATAIVANPTEAAIEFFKKMSGMLLSMLNNHSSPWFADQIALFRLIEEFPSSARAVLLKNILTDSVPPSPQGFFRILHASWE